MRSGCCWRVSNASSVGTRAHDSSAVTDDLPLPAAPCCHDEARCRAARVKSLWSGLSATYARHEWQLRRRKGGSGSFGTVITYTPGSSPSSTPTAADTLVAWRAVATVWPRRRAYRTSYRSTWLQTLSAVETVGSAITCQQPGLVNLQARRANASSVGGPAPLAEESPRGTLSSGRCGTEPLQGLPSGVGLSS